MSNGITRRNFLKLGGIGAAAATLTGCGPAARYVTRKPYYSMPEYQAVGKSTYYATACRECPAGCGLIMRTMEGRAIKAEGNPDHPVNRGKICSRGLTAVQGLYNPDRIQGPLQAVGGQQQPVAWEAALAEVKQALANPGGTAFYLGLNQDHLFDLVSELAETMGAEPPVRYGALGMFDGWNALSAACEELFGEKSFPYFDIGAADLVVSFGASFLETWVSPVAYSRGYSQLRRSFSDSKQRGALVTLEPRRGLTGGNADEWLPILPGSEGYAALALAQLLTAQYGASPVDTAGITLEKAAAAAGIAPERLAALAERISRAKAPVFLPGGAALAHSEGKTIALQIMALNVMTEAMGRPGGVFLAPAPAEMSSLLDVQALINRMEAGQVETLFVHGANPVFELPPSLGFTAALEKVGRVISFASFPDETAALADWVLPDHTPLEGWGYQRTLAGADRLAVSSAQPVVVPLYDTQATADVLLSAGLLPYKDEVDFIQSRLVPLLEDASGSLPRNDLPTFAAVFQQKGGWWQTETALQAPEVQALTAEAADLGSPPGTGADQYRLVIYPTQLGDGSGANRPWLQETPNADTTVMWNSWVEIHPETAAKLGVKNNDLVVVESPAGGVEAVVYEYPGLRRDVVAIPFGQGHTHLGRWAENRGVNPLKLVPPAITNGGDLAWADVYVRILPTGKTRPISRQESIAGVYGEH